MPVSPASVTMNGGNPSRAMMVPCTKPAAPQQSSGTTIAKNEPCLDMNALVSTPSANTDPTEGRCRR